MRRSFTRTKSSRMSSNPAPITGESDWRKVYTRRPMPRRRRKRWVSFKRKVAHVVQHQVAPKFQVFTRSVSTSAAENTQNVVLLHTVLGGNGSSPETNDVRELVERAQAIMPPEVVTPASILTPWRIHVTGWMIETQVTNRETYPIYIDMYYWRTKKDTPVELANVYALWEDSVADVVQNDPSIGGQIAIGDYGVTPFQGVQLAKHIQIWRKQRVKLAGGSTTQVEQRSGRNYRFDYSVVEHYSLLRRATEGILMVFYGSPGIYGVVPTLAALSRPAIVDVSTNVNYTWRVISSGKTSGAHVAG